MMKRKQVYMTCAYIWRYFPARSQSLTFLRKMLYILQLTNSESVRL